VSLRGTAAIEVLLDGVTSYDITPQVRRFRWTESMLSGGWSWSIHVTTNAWREWQSVALGRKDVRFRLKVQEGATSSATDWRRAYIDRATTAFRSRAATYLIEGADVRLELDQIDRTRAWTGRTVSDIVLAIGGEHDISTIVERTAARRDRWQCRETDWSFMKRLVAEAASSSGRGDYYLWHDGQNLRLDVPQVQNGSDRRHVLSEAENRTDRVVVGFQGREVDRAGGATLRAVGYDLLRGEAVVFTLDAGQSGQHPALARYVPRAQEGGLRVISVAETDRGHVEERARGVWGKVASRYFSLRLDSRPDLTLRPGQVIDVRGDLGVDQQTALLGRFGVLEVEHRYERGGLKTIAVCYRREAAEGVEEAQGAEATTPTTRDRYRFGQPQQPRTVLVAEVIE
jgi:hypothetical protein